MRQVLGTATYANLDLYSPRRSDRDYAIETAESLPSSWAEASYLLREQWHLLVQNGKLFGLSTR
ncbi:hypothetical protein ACFHW0_11110 [Micromonospora sp. LOL_025]|uniref:hypothetical protein n=1 Tax=Micromonospora sp. LOL_025 TaxID=3345413 RepID=UPI003A8C5144